MRDVARICFGLQGNQTLNFIIPCLQNKTKTIQQCATASILGKLRETVTTTRAGAFGDLFQGWNRLYPDPRKKQNKEKVRPSDSKGNSPYLLEVSLLPSCLAELISNGGQEGSTRLTLISESSLGFPC